jgi:hypothetical protein
MSLPWTGASMFEASRHRGDAVIRLAWLTVAAAFGAARPLPSQEPSHYRRAVINDSVRHMPARLELGDEAGGLWRR